tara:strand:+ start:323 stop:1021 length:699 start_codon:yes stop_codon:yes gene_type:complete
MSEEVSAAYVVMDVESMYPKLDRTYNWSATENRSVPCGALDDGAEYSVNFKMSKASAKELHTFMKGLYESKKQKSWPAYNNPFKKEEDGMFSYKASLKGAYNGQKTQKPTQYDAKVKQLPEDFQLTTGSQINLAVVGVPYSGSMGAGVSLRLKSVQVLKLAERQNVSPFEATDGFSFGDDNPFSAVEEPAKAEPEEDPFEEEIEEPKKVAKKTAAPKKEADDIADVLEDWDD